MLRALFKSSAKQIALHIEGTDEEFDRIYPRNIRRISEQHFTPLNVAKTAASFLVSRPATRVLDIGSGAGKFCFVGAASTKGVFAGIEQREDLVNLSNSIARKLHIQNVRFIHTNVMGIALKEFDAFYLFNPFYENVKAGERIDDTVLVSPSLFASYSSYTRSQLSEMPEGTRLATYYTSPSFIPNDYRQVESSSDGHLLLWEKCLFNQKTRESQMAP
ncbi:methyltransferase domain-containing protein [Chryseolinea sp. T2]|uniref:methyltransferase domain-containing protein n=1 Tax=Chryseolinea sp. T2 TaxID=3129255 RepID=UPI003077229E